MLPGFDDDHGKATNHKANGPVNQHQRTKFQTLLGPLVAVHEPPYAPHPTVGVCKETRVLRIGQPIFPVKSANHEYSYRYVVPA